LRQQLQARMGYAEQDLPSERSLRDILNRMGYRLKRIQKAKPLRKTKDTDAIFANVAAVRQEVKDDPQTLEISLDTKAKVQEGDSSRGGKNPDRLGGGHPQGMGPCPAGQGQVDAFWRADAGDGGADADLHVVAGDKRFLGGRAAGVVAVGQGRAGPRQAA